MLLLAQCNNWPAEIAIACFDEPARRPANEDPRQVARIILDQQLARRSPDIGRERIGPVLDVAEMDPVAPEGAFLLGQKGNQNCKRSIGRRKSSRSSCSWQTAMGGRCKPA